jgi:hypothetical protein
MKRLYNTNWREGMVMPLVEALLDEHPEWRDEKQPEFLMHDEPDNWEAEAIRLIETNPELDRLLPYYSRIVEVPDGVYFYRIFGGEMNEHVCTFWSEVPVHFIDEKE